MVAPLLASIIDTNRFGPPHSKGAKKIDFMSAISMSEEQKMIGYTRALGLLFSMLG
jgi:hypothetical protein